MKAYAYISARFETGFIVKIISESGSLITAFESKNYKKAPEYAQKYTDKMGIELQWLVNPWSAQEFKQAVNNYETVYGMTLNGLIKKEVNAW